jgi:tricorn protease
MKFFTIAALWGVGMATAFAAPGAIHLVQKPAMNKTEIVFSYSGDLWRVGREGGVATRLTSGPGFETMPPFPDGERLAFTGECDGNGCLHTVSGGVPDA